VRFKNCAEAKVIKSTQGYLMSGSITGQKIREGKKRREREGGRGQRILKEDKKRGFFLSLSLSLSPFLSFSPFLVCR